MNWVVWARVLPAVLMLPLGSMLPRLVLGVAIAALLSGPPLAVPPDATRLVGEIAIGALLGLLAGLPVRAALALRGDGPATLGLLGTTLTWSVFFGMGGAGLWIEGLARSLTVAPADLITTDAVVEAGAGLFYTVFMLGLPTWLVAFWVAPTAGWVDRVGARGLGSSILLVRPTLVLVCLAASLPFLLDVIRDGWVGVLGG